MTVDLAQVAKKSGFSSIKKYLECSLLCHGGISRERRKRAVTFVCAVVALALVAGIAKRREDSITAPNSDRIAALIKQLGANRFAQREAASKELADIGEQALTALQKATTSKDDVEIRWRAERIIQVINTRAADAAIQRELAAFNGRWNVEFTNGVTEVTQIFIQRTAFVEEPLRTASGKVDIKDGSVVIVYQDDRVERWTPLGKRMVVEHWYPGAGYPFGAPVLGVADAAQ